MTIDTAGVSMHLMFLRGLLSCYRYPASPESAMHETLTQILMEAHQNFRREVELAGGAGRIDFVVDTFAGCLGIECKVDGSPSDVAGQLLRYASAEHRDGQPPQASAKQYVDGLLLLTSRNTHARFFADVTELHGKPFRVLSTLAGSF